jgi:hypothetical protein
LLLRHLQAGHQHVRVEHGGWLAPVIRRDRNNDVDPSRGVKYSARHAA